MNSEQIKKMIPLWINSEIERLRKEFDPEIPRTDFEKETKNPKNWKRISKTKREDGFLIERVFDCKPLDDQLRAYVVSDSGSGKILAVQFQTE